MFSLGLVDKNNPVLRKKAKEITKIDDSIKKIVADMANLMYKSEGVGLAAPQVGISKRLVLIDVGEGLMALVNPEIIYEEGKEIASEGCLSIPGVFNNVERSARVVVKALNENGEELRIAGAGLLARALQHEIDHLEGILFIDKALPEEN